MKNMKKLSGLILVTLISTYISACNKAETTLVLPDPVQINSNNTSAPSTRAKLDSTPFITQGTELSAIAVMDDGKIIKYQTFSTAKAPTTIIYQSKWSVLESHATTSNEATTILKLVSQNGFSKEYSTLSQRYDSAGLTRNGKSK